MLLVASVFFVTMIVWMNRVARHLRKEIEEKVESYAERTGKAAGWGVFLFVFLLVLREGAELALILRAVELSTEGLQTWIGTIAGIAAAVAVGLFFFKGTLRIPLGRFFAATSVILMLVAFQLGLRGLHELSEARWLPSSKGEMAILGPIVSNELFFFVFIFGAAMLLILREWQAASHAKAAKDSLNDAERRLPELRRGRLSPGRAKCDLPALRFRDLYSLDWRSGRLQSHRRARARRWRRHCDRHFRPRSGVQGDSPVRRHLTPCVRDDSFHVSTTRGRFLWAAPAAQAADRRGAGSGYGCGHGGAQRGAGRW